MMASENETWFHPVWINARRRRVALGYKGASAGMGLTRQKHSADKHPSAPLDG